MWENIKEHFSPVDFVEKCFVFKAKVQGLDGKDYDGCRYNISIKDEGRE